MAFVSGFRCLWSLRPPLRLQKLLHTAVLFLCVIKFAPAALTTPLAVAHHKQRHLHDCQPHHQDHQVSSLQHHLPKQSSNFFGLFVEPWRKQKKRQPLRSQALPPQQDQKRRQSRRFVFPFIMMITTSDSNDVADETRLFSGSLYGVTATCELNMRTRVAYITLRGIAIGRELSGTGSLRDPSSESGSVKLDPEFAKALARRFIKIHGASYVRTSDSLVVSISIPIFGDTQMVLLRSKMQDEHKTTNA